jgi:hypothetical protein
MATDVSGLLICPRPFSFNIINTINYNVFSDIHKPDYDDQEFLPKPAVS